MASVFACLASLSAILLGGETVNGCVEAIVGGRLPGAGALTSTSDECVAVGGRSIAITPGMDAIYGRLRMAAFGIACLRGPIAPFGFLIACICVVDEQAHAFVARVCEHVPLIGVPIAFVCDSVALVGPLIPIISELLPLVGFRGPVLVRCDSHRSPPPVVLLANA